VTSRLVIVEVNGMATRIGVVTPPTVNEPCPTGSVRVMVPV